MAQDRTQVANIAIAHLGIRGVIVDLDTENSPEARAVRTHWDTALEQTFEDFPWSFATKRAALVLVDTEDWDDEWQFPYRYPFDAVCLRRILSGCRVDTAQSRIPYRIVSDDEGRLILTDKEDAEVEYTRVIDTVSRWTGAFVSQFTLRLAALCAPLLTGGDQGRLGERLLRLYAIENQMAKANEGNEGAPDEPPMSEMHRARR